MFAMLVVAAALIRFNVVHSVASNEDQFDKLEHVARIFSEDDMTPDFTEQLGSHDHTTDIKKRNDAGQEEKYRPPQNEVRTNSKPVFEKTVKNSAACNQSEPNAQGHTAAGRNVPGRNASGRNASEGEDEKSHILHEEMDVVDREDHITQYLSDQLVNTDSEISSLQANDDEDEPADSVELKEDPFFAFLSGQEKLDEVEARGRLFQTH